MRQLCAALCGLYLLLPAVASAQSCPNGHEVALQVLGSGGPIADDDRASSGYLIWHQGRARVLVDLGGGALLRYGQSGARFADLDAVLLTHLHADHSLGIPGLLKSGYFDTRERDLLIAGPTAGGNSRVNFPSIDEFLDVLLAERSGAYGYLSDYLDGSPKLNPIAVDAQIADPMVVTQVLKTADLSIDATPVSHGPVPAIAYRVTVGGMTIVFAGDQDGTAEGLERLASGVDLLVLHMPVPEDAGPRARALHAIPSRVGEQADSAKAKRVLLSHFMARSLADIDSNLGAFESKFDGEYLPAEDLMCVGLYDALSDLHVTKHS